VPTLHGAGTLDGALAETIFRDVPVRGRHRGILLSTLMPLLASTIQCRRPLRLIDLRGFGLQRLGVSRRELIDSNVRNYSVTRAWAAALYREVDDADGMVWIARQHDMSEAILLFETRVEREELEVIAAPRPLAPGRNIESDVLAAAYAAGIAIVLDR